VRQPLIVNQFSLSLANLYPTFSYPLGGSHYMAESGIIDYCRLNEIQVQAWSPLRGTLLNSPESATPEMERTAAMLVELARRKGTTPAAVALAWLLRHPAGIIPILGSTNPLHLAEDCTADTMSLSREEWYALFAAAGSAT
jgi:predicted oxidoreductase